MGKANNKVFVPLLVFMLKTFAAQAQDNDVLISEVKAFTSNSIFQNEISTISLDIDLTASNSSSSVNGTGLWNVVASLEDNNNINVVNALVTVGSPEDENVSAGSTSSLTGITAVFDMGRRVCVGELYIFVRVSKGSSPSVNFTLNDSSNLTDRIEAHCKGLNIIFFGVLADPALSNFERGVTELSGSVTLGVRTDVNFGSAIFPSNIWMIRIYLCNNTYCDGTQHGVIERNSTRTSETRFFAGTFVIIKNIKTTLNLKDTLSCKDMEYICVKFTKPDTVKIKWQNDDIVGSYRTVCREPSTTAIRTTEPSTTAVITTEPSTTEYSTTVQSTTAPSTTEISTTETSTTEYSTTEPSTTAIRTTEPSATAVITTEPPTTEYSTTVQSTIAPSTTEISTSEPSTTEYSTKEPSTTAIRTTEPSTSAVITTKPSTTEYSTTVQSTIAPSTTEISTSEPSTTEYSTKGPSAIVSSLREELKESGSRRKRRSSQPCNEFKIADGKMYDVVLTMNVTCDTAFSGKVLFTVFLNNASNGTGTMLNNHTRRKKLNFTDSMDSIYIELKKLKFVCSDAEYLCAKIERNPDSNKLFTIEGKTTNCMEIECSGGSTFAPSQTTGGSTFPPSQATEIICEGNIGSLNCIGGHFIHVVSATFGRHENGNVNCPAPFNSIDTDNTACGELDNMLNVTANICNNKPTCDLKPEVNMLGYDPCIETYKYLEIDFECIQEQKDSEYTLLIIIVAAIVLFVLILCAFTIFIYFSTAKNSGYEDSSLSKIASSPQSKYGSNSIKQERSSGDEVNSRRKIAFSLQSKHGSNSIKQERSSGDEVSSRGKLAFSPQSKHGSNSTKKEQSSGDEVSIRGRIAFSPQSKHGSSSTKKEKATFSPQRKHRRKHGINENTVNADASRPIAISEFPNHVKFMISTGQFPDEYEDLKTIGLEKTSVAGDLPENRCNNRYINILPYDHNRVLISGTGDYINASFMTGISGTMEYVATQGPLPITKNDFWRMIWDHCAPTIVMVGQCVEQGLVKCDHYWPFDQNSTSYGNITVTVTSKTTLPEWVIREFTIEKDGDVRVVRHFNYTEWPARGVPSETDAFMRFVRIIRDHSSPYAGPTVVHCSSGVGRTAVFIALDILSQQLVRQRPSDTIDIFGVVAQMRRERYSMIRNEAEYVFLHQAVRDLLQGKISRNKWFRF